MMNKNYVIIAIAVLVFLLMFYFIKNRSYYDPKGYTFGFRVVPKGGDTVPKSVCKGPNVVKSKPPPGGFCAIDTKEHAEEMCNNSDQCGGFTVYQNKSGWIPGAKAQLFNKAAARSGTKSNKDWNTWIKN